MQSFLDAATQDISDSGSFYVLFDTEMEVHGASTAGNIRSNDDKTFSREQKEAVLAHYLNLDTRSTF